MKRKLSENRLLTGSLMLALGVAVAGAADGYQPAIDESAAAAAVPAAAAETAETVTAAIEPRLTEVRTEEGPEETDESFIPHVVQLNLAHYYPEGADETEPLNSKAGAIFKDLMAKDEAWIGEIYDLSDQLPVQMASRLGRSQNAVMGHYNPDDERHDPADPSTWTVNTFKRVHITFKDGDGNTCAGYSNVIPIMSMASVYTWFDDMEDDETFREYVMATWEKSHSYTVSMGDVYYCNGCMGEDHEAIEREELLAEDAEEALALSTPAESGAAAGETVSSPKPQPETAVFETSESGGRETSAPETTTAAPAEPETSESILSSASAESVTYSSAEATGTETSAVTEATAVTETAAETMMETAAETVTEAAAAETTMAAVTKNPGPGVSLATASEALESSAPEESPAAEEALPEITVCPGHIDLYITARVTGIEEEKGLFSLDPIGNDESRIRADGWKGWNTYSRYYVNHLSKQDWYENYGLSVSALSFSRNPLADSEIATIMESLPPNLSSERRKLIDFALASVGRVPYYWGGKPSARDYAGNQFGVVTSADQDGRILSGLDCSGWISWVYWSATGNKLPFESTSGLATCGRRIQRYELEPGDIILRTGTNAHVIMFLGWTEDGRIICVHETTGGINNVTITERDANWPYYRRIVE